jgi:uncharacterized protein (TIGR02145 family)
MRILIVLLAVLCLGCNRELVSTRNKGTFIDARDSNKYSWVRLGNQIWMENNLAYLPSVNPSGKGSIYFPSYYVYEYEGENFDEAKSKPEYSKYGVLYNLMAARNACPEGWHLPSDKEWRVLETRLGMNEVDLLFVGWRESGSVGKKLKSDTFFQKIHLGKSNAGLAVLSGGYRTPLTGFQYQGTFSVFWTSTSSKPGIAWTRTFDIKEDGVSRIDDDGSFGFSVRCIKN